MTKSSWGQVFSEIPKTVQHIGILGIVGKESSAVGIFVLDLKICERNLSL